MYTDPEEARSDLFLVAAVYLFGPLLIGLVDGLLAPIPGVGPLFLVVSPLLTTALAPVLLARYRQEPASGYGLGATPRDGVRLGLLLAAPVVAAAVLAALSAPTLLGAPLLSVARGLEPIGLLRNVSRWAGLVVLALYATVKARDAFRSELRSVGDGVKEVGRVLGIAGGVAALLLLATVVGLDLSVVLLPLGVAAAVAVLLRQMATPATTTRATLVAPVVLLALGPLDLFSLFANVGGFVLGVLAGALLGAIGLVVAATLEARRSATPALVLAAALALFVPAFA